MIMIYPEIRVGATMLRQLLFKLWGNPAAWENIQSKKDIITSKTRL